MKDQKKRNRSDDHTQSNANDDLIVQKKSQQNENKEFEDEDYKLALELQKQFDEEVQNNNQQQQNGQQQQQQKQKVQQNKKQKNASKNKNKEKDDNQQEQQQQDQSGARRSSRIKKQVNNFNQDQEDQEFEDLLENGRQQNLYSNTWQLTDQQKKQGRIQRAKTQKMYLISAVRNSNEKWTFIVKGSKGTDYNIIISQEKLQCFCHDFRVRRKSCKHIFFIVSRIAQNEKFLTQMGQNPKLSIEKYQILDQSLIVRLKERLQKNKNGEKNELDINDIKDDEDKDCPICFDELTQDDIDRCSTCKKFFHASCMTEWLDNNTNCPLCRSEWKTSEENIEGAFQKLQQGKIKL